MKRRPEPVVPAWEHDDERCAPLATAVPRSARVLARFPRVGWGPSLGDARRALGAFLDGLGAITGKVTLCERVAVGIVTLRALAQGED